MADVRLPENIHNALMLVALIVGEHPHPRAADIGTALDDLRRAVAAALLRATADGLEDGVHDASTHYNRGTWDELRAQAAALEAGEKDYK